MGIYCTLRSAFQLKSGQLFYWFISVALFNPLVANAAVHLDLSGFGTVGVAVSDQDFTYERFINQHASLSRDSIGGIQGTIQFNPAWSFTAQAKMAPKKDDDGGYHPQLTWAFVSWRPTNDWLLRAGRLRVPLLLYSSNDDVAMTLDFLRLPFEVYSFTPITDTHGLFFSKTWLNNQSEWSLDGYAGVSERTWRIYLRDHLPPVQNAGAVFFNLDMRSMVGLVLSQRADAGMWRIGAHVVDYELEGRPLLAYYPFTPLIPGTNIGYYHTLASPLVPGLPNIKRVTSYALTLNGEFNLSDNTRVIGEYVHRRVPDIASGLDSDAAYVALVTRIQQWAPYVYWAGIRSTEATLDWYERLNENQVPAFIPQSALINLSQRSGADLFTGFDQQSWAMGVSYHLSPMSKLTAEWLYVRTGRVSSFIDAPAGEDTDHRQLHTFSLAYSFTF